MDKQREALERSIKAGAGVLTDKHAALLALCRELADQMDASGPEGPSTRLSAAYLSCLKDLARVFAVKEPMRAGGKLAQLRSIQGGATRPRTRKAAGS